MNPAQQLEKLRDELLGIMFDALTRPTVGTHGGDPAARDEAIGAGYRRIRERVDRVHEAYAAFAREQAKVAADKAKDKK